MKLFFRSALCFFFAVLCPLAGCLLFPEREEAQENILLLLPDVIYEQEYSRKSLERYKAARLDEKELEKWTKAFSEEQERLKRLHSDRSNFTAAAPAV